MQILPDIHMNNISLNPFKTESGVYESSKYPDFDLKEESSSSFKEKVRNSDETWVNYDVEIEGSKKSLTVKLKDPVIEESAKDVSYGRYHVVGGCFGVESNARKMVRRLKRLGYNADMNTMHNGLHVVSYESLSSESNARQLLAKVKKEHNNQAWLLVK